MHIGKNKCKHLKAVRKRIAEENGIPLELPWLGKGGQKARIGDECSYEGPCRGTCPRCEAEVRFLERILSDRIRLGKAATVAGLSLGLAACNGVNESKSPILTTDSGHSVNDTIPLADSIVAPDGDTLFPEVTELGFVITGDSCELPPPEKDSVPSEDTTVINDESLLEGEIVEGDVGIYVFVEKEASFPGGEEALYDWLERNINYPDEAREKGITGTVVVKFVVERDGSITHPRIVRDIGGGCGQEILRIMKIMPKWKPTEQSGKRVRMDYTLPVNFQ